MSNYFYLIAGVQKSHQLKTNSESWRTSCNGLSTSYERPKTCDMCVRVSPLFAFFDHRPTALCSLTHTTIALPPWWCFAKQLLFAEPRLLQLDYLEVERSMLLPSLIRMPWIWSIPLLVGTVSRRPHRCCSWSAFLQREKYLGLSHPDVAFENQWALCVWLRECGTAIASAVTCIDYP
jgi:hypothetical protein